MSARVKPLAAFDSLQRDWEEKCDRYLPVVPPDSPWRFNRAVHEEDPEQGWKLHLSATILTAGSILDKVAPFLSGEQLLFKAPTSLQEVKRINCGLFYGFSQVGKIFTVYPSSTERAVSIADALHRLTSPFRGPAVPYDLPYRRRSLVYYRYGSFKTLTASNDDGVREPAIRNAAGLLVPDRREPGAAVPSWLRDPFARPSPRRRTAAESLLKTTFRAYEALSHRGKGGVYRALDMRTTPPRLCVIKEGRRHGETDIDGRDGFSRVRHEGRVLRLLRSTGLEVPEVYAGFQEQGHYYLVVEDIDGVNLQLLLSQPKKLAARDALHYGLQLSRILHRIHGAGWVWRDCKPLNLIVTRRNALRPIDFEGACPVTRPDGMPWGTAGYVPPEWLADPGASGSRKPEDLYALGASLHQILTGRMLDPQQPLTEHAMSRRVPRAIREVVCALCDADPLARPTTDRALSALQSSRVTMTSSRRRSRGRS